MWRQGDVLIDRIEEIPPSAFRLKRPILASGDTTGHRHRIKDPRTARLLWTHQSRPGQVFLEVIADEATVSHPEHGEIVLPRGLYRVWRQREFEEGGPRFVVD